MLEFLLAASLFIAASYTDIRWREVPDWLNFSGICAGIGIHLLYAIPQFAVEPILEGLAGLALGTIIALAMFYTGQWGGGDAKLLMATGAILGLTLNTNDTFLSFLTHLFIAGGIYGGIWTAGVAITHRTALLSELAKKYTTRWIRLTQYGAFTLGLITLLATLLTTDQYLQLSLGILAISIPGLFFLAILLKTIEQTCFIKRIPVSELTEGDWIAHDVVVDGKKICGPNDLGASKHHITKLKELHVKTIVIKTGIPFVPAFTIALLLSATLGNPLILLINNF